MKHIEYEERVMISATDYQKIIDDIKAKGIPYTVLVIDNAYLDNKDRYINKNKMMLRIRRIVGRQPELTLKIHNENGLTEEINETLNSHPMIDEKLNNKFQEFYEIARLMTNRIEVQYEDYLFVVDKNQYSGIIDHDIEIEAESQEKALQIIDKYCEKYDLRYSPYYKAKSKRAIKAVKKKTKKHH